MKGKIFRAVVIDGMYHQEWYSYCDRCGCYIHESYPHYEGDDGQMLCGDCAFIDGVISEAEYLRDYCFAFPATSAIVHDGKVYVSAGEKWPWEKTAKDYRHSAEYISWRRAVFERDHYTCVICGQVGGELNAHHIKPFKDFEADRFNINNGVTLCVKCHRQVHKEKNSEWLYLGK